MQFSVNCQSATWLLLLPITILMFTTSVFIKLLLHWIILHIVLKCCNEAVEHVVLLPSLCPVQGKLVLYRDWRLVNSIKTNDVTWITLIRFPSCQREAFNGWTICPARVKSGKMGKCQDFNKWSGQRLWRVSMLWDNCTYIVFTFSGRVYFLRLVSEAAPGASYVPWQLRRRAGWWRVICATRRRRVCIDDRAPRSRRAVTSVACVKVAGPDTESFTGWLRTGVDAGGSRCVSDKLRKWRVSRKLSV